MTTHQRSSSNRNIPPQPYHQQQQQPPLSGDDLLTVKEVAVILRVDDTTIRRWIARGLIDAIELPHLGSRTVHRIRGSTVSAMLDKKRESAVSFESEEKGENE